MLHDEALGVLKDLPQLALRQPLIVAPRLVPAVFGRLAILSALLLLALQAMPVPLGALVIREVRVLPVVDLPHLLVLTLIALPTLLALHLVTNVLTTRLSLLQPLVVLLHPVEFTLKRR